jgi:hypothetical protein
MADHPCLPSRERAPEPARIEPCVKDWTCARCGRRLLLRIAVRRPGGCGHCGSLHLEPSASRPR